MTGPPYVFHAGEWVRFCVDGFVDDNDGEVLVTALNGRSLIVRTDAIVAGYVGLVPLLWTEYGWQTLTGIPVRINHAS
jgi:hypothetical protein